MKLRPLIIIALAGLAVGCGGGSSSKSASTVAAATSSSSAAPTTSSSATAPTGSSATTPPATTVRPPQVTSASVAQGYNDRATTLTLDGASFFRGAVVRLVNAQGVHAASQVTVQSEFRLEAVIPAGAPAGSYTVEVETLGGVAQGPSFDVINLADVDSPGAFEVGYEDLTMPGASGDQVDVRIYYPALTRGLKTPADPAAGPYPVVVYAHGFKPFLLSGGIDYRNNTFLVRQLASFGFVVICPDLASNNVYFGSNGTGQANSTRDAEDVIAALDFVTTIGQDPAHTLFSLIDEDTAALAGHSRGADGSLIAGADEVVARAAQARVKAIVALGPPATDSQNNNVPLQFGDFSSIPTFLVASTEDQIAPLSDQQAILALAGAPSWLFEIVGGSHSQYKDSATRILGDGTATLPLAEQQEICRRHATAWLIRHVKGVDAPLVTDRIGQGADVLADPRLQNVTLR